MKPVELARLRSNMIHAARSGAEQIGRMFTKPDEDWAPMVIGVNHRSKSTIIAVDGGFLSSERGKDVLADQVLPKLIKEHGFVALGMVISAWTLHLTDPDRDAPLPKPSESPNRIEALMLMGADRYGDEAYWARIVRHERLPPTLEAWERLSGQSEHFTGRMIDPLRRALRPEG